MAVVESLNSATFLPARENPGVSPSSGPGTKRKRSRAHSGSPTEEDNYLALCLVMLSRGDRASPEKNYLSFKCSICGKGFASHQALGGHKTSHRKITESSNTSAASGRLASSGGDKTHECSVCHRVFATGQALGGHKRCHHGEDAVSSLRDFDLNLPALSDEEMEGDI